jgi:hypothetical protein
MFLSARCLCVIVLDKDERKKPCFWPLLAVAARWPAARRTAAFLVLEDGTGRFERCAIHGHHTPGVVSIPGGHPVLVGCFLYDNPRGAWSIDRLKGSETKLRGELVPRDHIDRRRFCVGNNPEFD